MKNNFNRVAVAGLLAGGLLLLTNGCSKTETATPAPSASPTVAAPAPAAAPAPQAAKTEAPAPTAVTPPPVVEPTAPPAAAPAVAVVDQAKTNLAVAPKAPDALAQATSGLAALSQDQLTKGLKDALGSGLQHAVAGLGRDGGFLTNPNVKIPLPDKLAKVESALRAVKQEKLADDFVATMNHAAEQAVPVASTVFVDALKQMQISDVQAILTGPTDAATQFFQKATQTNLYAKFYPIVQQETAKAGVTSAYKKLVDKASVGKSFGDLGNALGNSLFEKESLDVDGYVTTKTLDGLFKMVAEEEKQIRQNPAARTTDLMQKVFSAVKK